MKGRESGMPDEAHWASFFDSEKAINMLLGPDPVAGNVVEFGCGYGTFTLPAARRTEGTVTALDIEPDMIAHVRKRAENEDVTNIRLELRDFVADGSGLGSNSQSHAMIYNLLHLENPVGLLREADRALARAGTLSVIHWRSDIVTPRGPSLNIRPRPEQCSDWMRQAGFQHVESVDLSNCCPWHFGLLGRRQATS